MGSNPRKSTGGKDLLFDDFVRTDDAVKGHIEPSFSFLNRTSRSEFTRVREVLENWYGRYPKVQRPELRARFQSLDDEQHEAALFELVLFELLVQLGCAVTLHPDLTTGSSKRPDFLVESPDGRFYLEAVLASDKSKTEKAALRRQDEVYEVLERIDSPNFFIGMDLKGAPKTPPPVAGIRDLLSRNLRDLDPDEVSRMYEFGGLRGLPRWRFEHDGWLVEFYPIPKRASARGKRCQSPLGIRSYGFSEVRTAAAIRRSLFSKAGKYGDLGVPYVIAVNVLPYGAPRDEIMEALFGDEKQVIRFSQGRPIDSRTERTPNGVWTLHGGPRYTRLSAVLVFSGLQPWTVGKATECLYDNPWAKFPYKSALTRLPRAIAVDDRMHWEEGEPLTSILNLPPNWPWDEDAAQG